MTEIENGRESNIMTEIARSLFKTLFITVFFNTFFLIEIIHF